VERARRAIRHPTVERGSAVVGRDPDGRRERAEPEDVVGLDGHVASQRVVAPPGAVVGVEVADRHRAVAV
jgi:hypothetical protein